MNERLKLIFSPTDKEQFDSEVVVYDNKVKVAHFGLIQPSLFDAKTYVSMFWLSPEITLGQLREMRRFFARIQGSFIAQVNENKERNCRFLSFFGFQEDCSAFDAIQFRRD